MAGRKYILIVLSLVILIALLLFYLPQRRPAQSVTLPGGAKITFAGVSYGKATAIPPTGSWKRYLALLPKPALKLLKINPVKPVSVRTNHIILWFFSPFANTMFGGRGNTIGVSDTILSLQDENGAECVSPNYSFAFSSFKKPDGSLLRGIDLDAFPRRAKTFKLRIYSGEQDPSAKRTLVGEFTIPNPAFRKYPDWQPAPLPVTRTNGGVAVTLTKFLTGASFPVWKPAGSNQESWVHTSFTLTRNGKPCADWQVDTIQFSDATGNSTHPSAWSNEHPWSNIEDFSCRAPLWPAEKAWKLDVKFKHQDNAAFATNEICTFAAVPLPEANARTNLDLETNLNGVNLKLLSIQDATASTTPEAGAQNRLVTVYLKVGEIPDGIHLDTFGSTGTGIRNQVDSNGVMFAVYELDYPLPPSAKTMDVKVAVYRELTAQFIVKPTVLSPSNSTPSKSAQ